MSTCLPSVYSKWRADHQLPSCGCRTASQPPTEAPPLPTTPPALPSDEPTKLQVDSALLPQLVQQLTLSVQSARTASEQLQAAAALQAALQAAAEVAGVKPPPHGDRPGSGVQQHPQAATERLEIIASTILLYM